MREQDILERIKASAEDIEVPKSLMPDNVEKMLKENVAKRWRVRFQPLHLVAASVVLVIMIGLMPLGFGIGGVDDNASTGKMDSNQNTTAMVIEGEKAESVEEVVKETLTIAKKENAGELYQVAKSYEEIYDFIEKEAEAYYYYDMVDGAVFEAEVMEEASPESAVNSSPIEKNQISDSAEATKESIRNEVVQDMAVEDLNYSKTNVQMAGVDESDIVKTNGTHIFTVKNDVVIITKVENGQLEHVGTIAPKLASFTDTVLEMYVDDDRLVLIVQQAKDTLENESAAWGEGPIDDDMMVDTTSQSVKMAVDVAYNFLTTYNTVLYTYDISNPARPIQIGQMEQDGNYYTSRKIEDIIYLFTYDGIVLDMKRTDKGEAIAELLPKVNGETFAYDSIYLPERGTQGLVVSSLSVDKPNTIVDKTLILNDYVNIYVSNSAMYLYRSNYTNTEVTEIAKFILDKGQIFAVAASSVLGSVQDTFAINEYQGNLRVLTSGSRINGAKGRINQLYIMDKDLKPAGKIENIAPDETIYAARYFGDLAYFITYRNTDPLFAADLSDINNPKILGELEITGYSEYLHMWGEDKLLGIGYETDPKTGRNKGIKLVMFDISNPKELAILDTMVLKDVDYSAALYYYKCVLADNNANMIGFPITEYGDYAYGVGFDVGYQMYSFADGEFKEELHVDLGKVQNDADIRGLYIGEYFYLVSDEKIESYHRMDSYREVSELEF